MQIKEHKRTNTKIITSETVLHIEAITTVKSIRIPETSKIAVSEHFPILITTPKNEIIRIITHETITESSQRVLTHHPKPTKTTIHENIITAHNTHHTT